MAFSSRRSARRHRGTLAGEGDLPVTDEATTPGGRGDNGGNSSSCSESLEPLEEVLGRHTIDPWHKSSERFPSVPANPPPPPVDCEWLVIREDAIADTAWVPSFREIRDLQIQRNEILTVPLIFDFQCSKAIGWETWIDRELADGEFCDRLGQAGVLHSILISRSSNMFRDTKALRQLVRRWCPSTHTFFFSHGELTEILEDVENHWLLPILGDQDPAEVELSPEELRIKAALADYIGRKNTSLGTQAARFTPWMDHFKREKDASIRRATFVAYWLSKCVFGEPPAYSIKPLYFPIAVKIVVGVCFPLAPLLLRQLYAQLDLLHAEELIGLSCHTVAMAFNSFVVHTFLWEHALEISLICCRHVFPHYLILVLFVATNTMTTYANRQSLGYVVWRQEELRWMIFGNHHPPLWLRDHPHVPAPGKVASNRGRRTASVGTSTAKKG
jgi:hypothetical protein